MNSSFKWSGRLVCPGFSIIIIVYEFPGHLYYYPDDASNNIDDDADDEDSRPDSQSYVPSKL